MNLFLSIYVFFFLTISFAFALSFSLSTSRLGNQALFEFVNMGMLVAGFVIHGF